MGQRRSDVKVALVAMRWKHAARAHAHEARVHAGAVVAVQLEDLHERADLDPRSFARAQRAGAFGRLLVGLLQNAAAHALALRDTELCGLHAAGERFVHALRHVAVVGNPVFFNPGRATSHGLQCFSQLNQRTTHVALDGA